MSYVYTCDEFFLLKPGRRAKNVCRVYKMMKRILTESKISNVTLLLGHQNWSKINYFERTSLAHEVFGLSDSFFVFKQVVATNFWTNFLKYTSTWFISANKILLRAILTFFSCFHDVENFKYVDHSHLVLCRIKEIYYKPFHFLVCTSTLWYHW